VDRQKGKDMARIFRIWVELQPVPNSEDSYEFRVYEQIRTAAVREVCTLQVGRHVRFEDLSTLVQIIDDVIQAAVARTYGIQSKLHF
jgi:hypothetical protein